MTQKHALYLAQEFLRLVGSGADAPEIANAFSENLE
jgi:hypothetical protein